MKICLFVIYAFELSTSCALFLLIFIICQWKMRFGILLQETMAWNGGGLRLVEWISGFYCCMGSDAILAEE
ncbi:hypothetical protein VNO77_17088 [Canavalia gladiata]|uniref:Uncharacterized protein n=1 Tax=Canavalia gladiata TaxID=3824 RepID=A0AAN9QGA5_CANGL